jgi:large subunit ribosomal protein L21
VRIAEILTGGAKPSKQAKAATAAPLFTAPAGEPDDLVVIKGIGPVAAGQLKEQGITTFAQVAAFTDEDIARIDAAMPFSADQIKDWREQAKELAK